MCMQCCASATTVTVESNGAGPVTFASQSRKKVCSAIQPHAAAAALLYPAFFLLTAEHQGVWPHPVLPLLLCVHICVSI